MFFILFSLKVDNFLLYNVWGKGKAGTPYFYNDKIIYSTGSSVLILSYFLDTLSSITLNDFIQDLVLEDTFLYICAEEDGFFKYLISENSNSFNLDSLKLSNSSIRVGILNDSLIIVLTNSDLFAIKKENLYKSDSIFVGGQPQAIYIQDTLIFVGCGYLGLNIYSYTNNNIILVGSFSSNIEYVSKPVVKDSICYIANSSNYLILNISDLTSPSLVNSITINDICTDLLIQDTLLYVLGLNYLQVYSISNPVSPLFIKRYNFGGYRFTYQDTLMLVSSGISMRLLNIINPKNIFQTKEFECYDMPFHLSHHDSILYVSHFFSGVSSLQDSLYYLQSFKNLGVSIFNSIYRDYMFSINFYGGIYLMDLFNSNFVNYLDFNGSENSVIFYDTIAFLANREGGLRAINVKDINNIYEICNNNQKNVYALSNFMNYIYCSLNDEGVGIYEFQGDSLKLVSSIPTIYNTDKVEVFNKYVFFNDGDSIIKIYDISNPVMPSFVSKITGLGCKNFKVLGDYIFTFNGNNSKTFSLKNIFYPEKIGEIIINDEITSISSYPPFVYIGNKNIGIRTFLFDSSDIMPPRYHKNVFVNNDLIPQWTHDDSILISFEHYFDDTLPEKILFKYSNKPWFKFDTSFTKKYENMNYIFPRKEGIDTIFVWFEDTIGNVDYRLNKNFIVKYDTTKPGPPQPLFPLNSFISLKDTFFFSKGEDFLSGIKKYIIQFDSVSSFSELLFSDTIQDTFFYSDVIPKNRNIYWRILSVDSASNISEPSIYYSFYIDDEPPIEPESIFVDSSYKFSLWKNDSVFSIRISGYDTSGISRIMIKEGSPPSFNYDTTSSVDTLIFDYIFNKEGIESVWVWLVDGVGNTDFNNSSFFVLRRDTTPPDTLLNLSIQPFNWTNKDTFLIRWNIPYDLSGIKRILFKKDNPPESIYDTTFTLGLDTVLNYILNEDGIHKIYIWLLDSAGNSSISKLNIVTLKLDRIKPEIPLLVYPPDCSFLNENPTLKWTPPFDSISGTMGYLVYIDTTYLFLSPLIETTYTESLYLTFDLPLNKFLFWTVPSFDSAFNFSNFQTPFSFYLDKIAPLPPESIYIDDKPFVSKWKRDSIYTIKIKESSYPTKSDTSGIEKTLYKIGSHPSFNLDTTGSSTFNPFNIIYKGEGIDTLWIWLLDRAGNTDFKNSSFGIIKRDTTEPDTANFFTVIPSDWTQKDTFILKYKTPNDLSGIYNISLKMKYIPLNPFDTSLTSFSDSFIILNTYEGVTNLYFWFFDSAGNSNFKNFQTRSVKRDVTKPIFNSISYNDTLFQGDSLHIILNITDSVSGIKNAFVKVKNYNINKDFTRYIPLTHYEVKIPHYEIFGNSKVSINMVDYAGNSNEIYLDYYQYFDNIIKRDSFGNPVNFNRDIWHLISSPISIDIRENFSYLGDFKTIYLIDTIYLDYYDSLYPGEGLFFKILNKDNILKFRGNYIKNLDGFYKISLKKGWNIVGNPFMFTIKTKQMILKGEPVNYLWGFEDDWFLTDIIKPFEAGLFYAKDFDTLLIYPDTSFNAQELLDLPYIKIEFFNDSVKDFSNYLILEHIESEKWIREPPGMSSNICFIKDDIRYSLVSLDTTGLNVFKLEVKEKGNIRFIVNENIKDIYILYDNVLYRLIDFLTLRDVNNEIKILTGDVLRDSLKDKIFYACGTLFRDRIFIQFFAGEISEVKVSIFDISGRMLFEKQDNFNIGFNLINTDISKSGVYFLRITNGKNEILKKILLIK